MTALEAPVRLSAPTERPVTLTEVKAALRIYDSYQDAHLDHLISAAVAKFDGPNGRLRRCLVSQSWEQRYARFPGCSFLQLPFHGVTAATVTYVDAVGATQTLPSTEYTLVRGARGAVLELKAGRTWPKTDARSDAVIAQMVCGYGGQAAVPEDIKAAIILDVQLAFGLSDAPKQTQEAIDEIVARYAFPF